MNNVLNSLWNATMCAVLFAKNYLFWSFDKFKIWRSLNYISKEVWPVSLKKLPYSQHLYAIRYGIKSKISLSIIITWGRMYRQSAPRTRCQAVASFGNFGNAEKWMSYFFIILPNVIVEMQFDNFNDWSDLIIVNRVSQIFCYETIYSPFNIFNISYISTILFLYIGVLNHWACR